MLPDLADVSSLVPLLQKLDHERLLGAVVVVQLEPRVLREHGVAHAQDVPVPPPDPRHLNKQATMSKVFIKM